LELDCGPWGRRIRACAKGRCACVCVSLLRSLKISHAVKRTTPPMVTCLYCQYSTCNYHTHTVHCIILLSPPVHTIISSPSAVLPAPPLSIRISFFFSSSPPVIPLQSLRLPSPIPTAKSPVGCRPWSNCALSTQLKHSSCRPHCPGCRQIFRQRRCLNTRPSHSQSSPVHCPLTLKPVYRAYEQASACHRRIGSSCTTNC
jgi:hypothetical protein